MALQLIIMWFIDSVSPHTLQVALCSKFRMSFHFLPIIKALWMVLNRNCCTLVLNTGFLLFFQIIASVSIVPFVCSIATFIILRFSCVLWQGGVCLFSIIPCLAVDWLFVLILS